MTRTVLCHVTKTIFLLVRCHLPNGKTIWLCPEHRKLTRVTILANDLLLSNANSGRNVEVVEDAILLHACLTGKDGQPARDIMKLWKVVTQLEDGMYII